jgi:hypothetical protein
MTSTIVHTSSREADARLAIARIAASGRIRAERQAAEARREAERQQHLVWLSMGQSYDEVYGDFCHICGRCTDHLGEHTPEQIEAWRAGRGQRLVAA